MKTAILRFVACIFGVTHTFTLLVNRKARKGHGHSRAHVYAGRTKTMATWQTYPSAGDATTTWSYDNGGLLTSKVYQYSSNWIAYAYSAAGRLTNRAWARGLTTGYTYNNAGDLASIAYSDGTAVTNSHDRLGRLTAAANSAGLVQRAYDLPGNLLTETQNGLVVSNTFDSLNHRRNVTVHSPAGALSSATYDFEAGTGRLGSVSDGTNNAAYCYLANSSLVRQIAFSRNGTKVMTTTKQYDRLNRLTRVRTLGASPLPLASFDYAHNDANQRARVAQADGSCWLYRYDRLGQVVSGKKYWRDVTPVTGKQYEYTFDDIGNRTKTNTGGDARGTGLRPAAYTNNLLNQITGRDVPGTVDLLGIARANASVTVNSQSPYRKDEYFARSLSWNTTTGAVSKLVTNWAYTASDQASMSNVGGVLLPKTPETFTYDLDGNLTRDGLWNYAWDAENRLIRMTSRASIPTNAWQSLGFRYDAQSRRISKTVSNWTGATWVLATEQRFVYDGWNLLAVLNPDLSPRTTFTWGPDASGSPQGAGGVGGLLATALYSGTNAGTYFPCYDGNGNVMSLVKAASAEVAAQYEHGPFHELIRATGPLAHDAPVLAATKHYDWETGLYYYGHRYYSPSLGRWLSPDPLQEAGGPNLYGMAGNDPRNHFDLLGLADTCGQPCATACEDARKDFPELVGPMKANGFVVCCDGKKISCLNKPGGADTDKGKEIAGRCVMAHEDVHHASIECPASGLVVPE